MKRLAAACASLLMLGLALPAASADEPAETVPDQLDQARERGGLEVAVYRDFPPYSYQDQGRYTGVDVDLTGALAKQLGLTLRLRPITAGEDTDDDLRNNIWKGHYLGGGVADLMLHVGMDPQYVERQHKAELIGAYFHEAVSIAYRPGRYRHLQTPLELAGSQVAVELASISDYFMSGAYAGRLRTSAVRMPTAMAAVQAFANDEVDAVMAPRGELQGLLKQLGGPAIETRSTEIQGLFRTQWDVGMAIKAGNPKLKSALLEALSQLRQSGELQRIFAQYGIDYMAPEI
jgi:polar amino acid transport system substrate-binding protein